MAFDKNGTLRLRANIAEYPSTLAMRQGQIVSRLVELDFCGPEKARAGFRPMLRDAAFDVGELALMTVLQAKAYGKPVVLLPAPVSGRFQHHCVGYNADFRNTCTERYRRASSWPAHLFPDDKRLGERGPAT